MLVSQLLPGSRLRKRMTISEKKILKKKQIPKKKKKRLMRAQRN
jgi:hypothetical protein